MEAMYLAPSSQIVVLWIHIIAACVWIGGQITLGMLVPVLRVDRDLVTAAARRFGWLGWTAFAVLIITGLINMHEIGVSLTNLSANPTSRTLSLKLAFVIISGLAAAIHSFLPRFMADGAPRRALTGIVGALALLAALAAAFYGVVIAEH
jgi:putative copper export protein